MYIFLKFYGIILCENYYSIISMVFGGKFIFIVDEEESEEEIVFLEEGEGKWLKM